MSEPDAPNSKESSQRPVTLTKVVEVAALAAPDASSTPQFRDFRVLMRLGKGGMGVVYRAHQLSMDRDVALKILPQHLAESPDFVDRFHREARMSAKLDHPNVVRGVAVGEENGAHYFAMEFVDGKSLDEVLAERGRLNVHDAVKITLDVAHALQHAHSRGLIHRDIKPANIMITRDGVVKLLDLGIAKVTADDAGATQTGAIFGTPSYMPPEQARDAKRADARSDIYALGATLYHLLTGAKPFIGATMLEVLVAKEKGEYQPVRHHSPSVPEAAEAIVDKMMAPDPDDRFQSAAALITALEATGLAGAELSWLGRQQLEEEAAVGVLQSVRRRRRPSFIGWRFAAVVVALCAGGYFAWETQRDSRTEQQQPGAGDSEAGTDAVLVRACDQAAQGLLGEARDTLAEALRAHPGVEKIEQPLRELEHGVLVLFQYQTVNKTGAITPLSLASGLTLTQRDGFRFALIPSRECHVYVFEQDSRPSVDQVFPNERYTSQENPLPAARVHWVPAKRATKSYERPLWMHLDEWVGAERVYFVAVTKPLRDPKGFSKRLLTSSEDLRATLARDPSSLLEAGEPPGTSCFAEDPLPTLTFNHK